MIYCPYVLIKLFQQSDSEKRVGGRIGKEPRIQIKRQKEESRKEGMDTLRNTSTRTKSSGDRSKGK